VIHRYDFTGYVGDLEVTVTLVDPDADEDEPYVRVVVDSDVDPDVQVPVSGILHLAGHWVHEDAVFDGPPF
jgi:hypothetical protein